MKTLVAYYSRTGHTKFISEKISQLLDAELCAITDKKNRDGRLGFIGGGSDAMREKLTDIEVSKSIEEYDLVVIGSPVWAGKIAPAIRKFIVTNDFKEKDVALFVTLDGNKPEKSLENMRSAISAKRIVSECGFTRPMKDQEKTELQIKTWCDEIGQGAKSLPSDV